MTDIENNEKDIKLIDIINDIQSGVYDYKDILKKYNLTRYKYDCILKNFDIKNPAVKKGPKNTKFKRLLNSEEKDNKDKEQKLDIESFKQDCKNGMKIAELMEKYKLSLYQVRELRIKYDLKIK